MFCELCLITGRCFYSSSRAASFKVVLSNRGGKFLNLIANIQNMSDSSYATDVGVKLVSILHFVHFFSCDTSIGCSVAR